MQGYVGPFERVCKADRELEGRVRNNSSTTIFYRIILPITCGLHEDHFRPEHLILRTNPSLRVKFPGLESSTQVNI